MTTVGLNPRRQAILDLIVGDYIRTAAPVASQQIARRAAMSVSSATIRNDMAELEEMGYINRPHSSAGGVPVEPGYRFYAERRAHTARPSAGFEELVQDALGQHGLDFDGLARGAADVLARSNRNVGVASAPHVTEERLRQLQLVQLRERRALLVVVLESTQVLRQPIELPQDTTQDELYEVANRVNAGLRGQTAQEMRTTSAATEAGEASNDIGKVVAAEAALLIANAMRDAERHPHVEGLRHLLGQPEFTDATRAREAVEVIEDEDVLRYLLADDVEAGEVHVIIGRENPSEQLRSYSVITSRYGRSDGISGVIAVVGPTRMDYAQAMASVAYLADVLDILVRRLDAATG